MINELKKGWDSLLGLLFPRYCPVCGIRLIPTEETMCIRCLHDLPLVYLEGRSEDKMIRHVWPDIPIEHGLCLFYYRKMGSHHNLLMQLKYMKNAKLARDLGKLAAKILEHHEVQKDVDVVIPVPLSRRRRLQRGYNQSEWLAQGLAQAYGLPVCTTLLMRVKHRKLQTQLNHEERKQNVIGLYHAKVPIKMRGKHFLLVDDVCTTGSTLRACAKAILESDPTARVSIFALSWTGE